MCITTASQVFSPGAIQQQVWPMTPLIENSASVFMARVLGINGDAIVQADITSVSVKVFDLDAHASAVYSATPSVADVVFDLRQYARWTIDNAGYNVALSLPGSAFPEGNRLYRVEVKFTPVAGNAYFLLFDNVTTANVFTE